MKEIRATDFLRFLSVRKSVQVEGRQIPLGRKEQIRDWGPPQEYKEEADTVWSFPDRGDWATHNGHYRGNWSPYIPRNLIKRFTSMSDWVLDPMMGGGTTLVESRILGRNAIGIDVNLNAVILARDRLKFRVPSGLGKAPVQIKTYVGDARRLNKIGDESIDLVATHPPYGGIIKYGGGLIEGDLSGLSDFEDYLNAMSRVASQCYRVLKRNKQCAVLIGDTRRHRHYVPISHKILNEFIAVGFVLLEDIVKVQHNTTSNRNQWRGDRQAFYKIAHEHLFVFRKPGSDSERGKLRLSGSSITKTQPRG